MSASLRHAGAFFLFATTAAVLTPGCVDNESSLYIRQCLHMPTSTCEVKPDTSSEFDAMGILDTSFGTPDKNGTVVPVPYTCPLLIGNQLVARGDPDRVRTETSRISIYGADVTVMDPTNAILTRSDGSAAQFFTPTSGFADPGMGAQPGLGIAVIEMIDPALALDLRKEVEKTGFEQQVVVSVVLHGRTLGGNEISSAPWNFPIRVCKGCLCDLGPCINASGTDMPADNCHAGIDDPVDCRLGLVGCPP